MNSASPLGPTLIYLFDYASIYLSIKLEKDPTPVEAIDFIKNNLKGI